MMIDNFILTMCSSYCTYKYLAPTLIKSEVEPKIQVYTCISIPTTDKCGWSPLSLIKLIETTDILRKTVQSEKFHTQWEGKYSNQHFESRAFMFFFCIDRD
jgi:hypothetical protein